MSARDSAAVLHVVESRIVAATVFSESAHVTRRVELPLDPGAQRIALRGLPSSLDPGSIRVMTTRGLVRAIERDTLERREEVASDSTALRLSLDALSAKLHRLSGEIEALQLELQLIDQVSPAPHAGLGSAPLRPDVFLAGLDVLTRRRAETIALLRRTEVELAEATADRNDAERRLALVGQTAGADPKQSVLMVSLDVVEPGEAALELTYEALWATWRPYYHVRLHGKDNTVECVRFADVWQETGEDWVTSRLRLSTAEPEAGLRVPAVLPWTLGLAKSYEDKVSDLYATRRATKDVARPAELELAKKAAPPAKTSAPTAPSLARSRTMVAAPQGAAAPMKEEATRDLVPAAPSSDVFEAYAEQFEEEGIFAEATASGLIGMRADAGGGGTIDGASEPGATLIGGMAPPAPPPPGGYPPPPRRGPSYDHPDLARLRGSALPRDTSGGIDFELEVGGLATCLSGKERQRLGFGSVTYPAKIEYLLRPAVKDHAFGRVTVVNSEAVPMLAGPAAIFVGEAFFGETEIKTTPAGGRLVLDLGAETSVKSARRTKTTVRTEGILTKEDIHVVEVTIEIENFLGRTVELEVQDQVPLSRDPRIKVRLVRSSPKDAVLDELTGVITFRLRAPSGTRTEVSLVYEIEAPKDYQFRQSLAG